ncbi:branched-chain amino acid ABC transporter permease [Mesorhizobium qingshengii]|uniref:Branched-chain amino acid transport system permease protein n=1 Tax=Mesorhizobium qingshengii TaxID=1165689 RepID=A0A1G5ZA71_9HYPH|nr:branched-chain amino acid ABC transporter permease [Mesorhizobium qingshengii]SDA91300.1 branched-chain amino acid transport system permease protein [Mesorhizobium qingshengii]
MEIFVGYGNYTIALATMIGIYSIMALGLNIQWGLTGLFNLGIAGFFAVGAYASAILTTSETPKHIGGFDLPVVLAWPLAMIAAAFIAWAVARICIRLRADYLAIATIGIGEILRLIFKNEQWATGGTRGISNISRPFEQLPGIWAPLAFLGVVLILAMVAYWLAERGRTSPWGRVVQAIRDNEPAARAAGKNVETFRIQGFVIGSAFMGLAGALTAHYFKFVGPEATDPLQVTFLVWVMLIVGGNGSNRGAMLGAAVIWTMWSASELFSSRLSGDWAHRAPFVRLFLVGLILQIMLQYFPDGLMPRQRQITARLPRKPTIDQPQSSHILPPF